MKKNILFLLGAVLLLAACNSKEPGIKVNLNLTNGNDQTVYLSRITDNQPVVVDSAVIKDDKAVLHAPEGNVEDLYAINREKGGYLPFFPENHDVNINGDLNVPEEVKVEAGKAQNLFEDYLNEQNGYYMQIESLFHMLDAAQQAGDQTQIDSLNGVGNGLMEAMQTARTNFINTHPESFVAHYVLNSEKIDYDLDQIKEMETAMTTESIYRTDLKQYIDDQERLEVGHPFLDFTLKTADGQEVTLAEQIAKNKVTMIDFWASWCGPCRQENPTVKAAYEQFHDKGFDILGVSVDQDEAAWLKAVEQDGLLWTQVRDVDNEAGKLYSVYAIPSNFLFDQEGNIIAKGLRGEALAEKLTEILK